MKRTILMGACLFLGLSARAQSTVQKPSESRSAQGTLYLAGAYQFAEVDLKTNTAKTWPMLTLAGLKDSPECEARHAPQSCDWHASETRLDLKSRRMYFVTPAANPGDEPDAEEETEAEAFVVWAVGLADLKPIKRIAVPIPQQSMPTILLIENGKKLVMSYRDEDGQSWHVDAMDTATWAKVSTLKDTSGDIQNTYFPTATYLAPSGKFIVNGDVRVWMKAGPFQAEYVDPRAKLTADEEKKLSGFFKTMADGKKVLPATAAASMNGTTLEIVTNEALTDSAFWTIDMETGASSPVVLPKYLAKGELLGRGEEMALFEGRMIPATQTEGFHLERTGHVAIYNVKSGALAREFNLPELQGAGELLCTTTDGGTAAYGHRRDELLLLDLKAGRVTRVAGKFDEFPQAKYTGACEFEE